MKPLSPDRKLLKSAAADMVGADEENADITDLNFGDDVVPGEGEDAAPEREPHVPDQPFGSSSWIEQKGDRETRITRCCKCGKERVRVRVPARARAPGCEQTGKDADEHKKGVCNLVGKIQSPQEIQCLTERSVSDQVHAACSLSEFIMVLTSDQNTGRSRAKDSRAHQKWTREKVVKVFVEDKVGSHVRVSRKMRANSRKLQCAPSVQRSLRRKGIVRHRA
eukprot:992469-Rhodomonas_salina.3